MLCNITKSLSTKILIVLSFSVALVMSGAIFLTYFFETKEMLKTIERNSRETDTVVYAAIKHVMSIGDGFAVQKQLIDMKNTMKGIDIYICNNDRRITFATSREVIGTAVDKHLSNPEAIAALKRDLQGGQSSGEGYLENSGEGKYLVHIYPIPNQNECFRCHGSQKNILGAIVSRKSIGPHYASIAGIRNINTLISVLGIFAFVFVAHRLLVKLVSRPIKALSHEIRHLPEQLAEGRYIPGENVCREDEIGVLQKSFHDMAIEIYEKNHTIEKSNSDLESANKELEAFAYSVSHDLRAPLRNIDGFSKILLDEYREKLDDRAKHYLMRVRNGTERMSLLIDDMLTFSRIGRTELQFRKINCAEIIKPILEYYSAETEARKVSVVLQELPDIVCDPVLMQSLFANFISNAFKYSRKTEQPEIVIGYDKDRNAIFVKDNGVGFEMKYHDKVFQVFQRLHLPEEYEGTGIGLAIVRRIAERHNSRVWAESEQGKGSTFYMDIPAGKEV